MQLHGWKVPEASEHTYWTESNVDSFDDHSSDWSPAYNSLAYNAYAKAQQDDDNLNWVPWFMFSSDKSEPDHPF